MLPELFLVLLRHSKPIKQNHDFHFGGCIVQRVMSLAKNDLRSGIEKQCPRVKCLVNREGVRDRKSSVVFDYVSACECAERNRLACGDRYRVVRIFLPNICLY
jgi:hypothetical protein